MVYRNVVLVLLVLAVATPAQGQLTQITTSPASDVWPSWTPDNAYLVFASDRDQSAGNYRIYKIPAAGGTAVLLSTESGNYPEVSPDGTQIAFGRDNEIHLLPISGGSSILLASDGYLARHPSWSPDGSTVFFTRLGYGSDYDLMQVPAGGGMASLFLNTDDAVSGCRISPDGLKVCYERKSSCALSFNLFEGTIERPTAQLTFENANTAQACYSPDGTQLAFVSRKINADLELYLLDLGTTATTRLTFDSDGTAFDPATQGPFFSPDGTRIAFSSRRITGDDNIWVLALPDSQLTQITTSPASDVWPSWTPDGAYIVFASDRDQSAGNYRIYKIPAAGGTAVLLSTESGNFPEVSPDGAQIAFGRDNGIYLLPISGGSSLPLASAGTLAEHPSWSPDGSTVFFTRLGVNSDWDLMQVPAGGGTASVFLDTDDTVSGCRISPDGLKVCYERESLCAPPFNLFEGTIERPTGQLTFENQNTAQPCYSPDGTQLAFVSRKINSDLELYLMDLGTGETTRLTFDSDSTSFDPAAQGPFFSPDGTRIAFSSRRITGDDNIWVLNIPVAAAVDLDPGTADMLPHTQWIISTIEFPPPIDPSDIVPSTVQLASVPADPGFDQLGDADSDGIPDRQFRFDRSLFVQAISLDQPGLVDLPVTGSLSGDSTFAGKGAFDVAWPHVLVPNGGEKVHTDSTIIIQWELPSGWSGTTTTLSYSTDGGNTWDVIASGLTSPSYVWTVPGTPALSALVKAEAFDEYGSLGQDQSDAPFIIWDQSVQCFTEIAASAGVQGAENSFGVAWGDYDNDGDPDIFVTASVAPDFTGLIHLYRNDGGMTFVDVAPALGLVDSLNGNGAVWGDLDNDGDLDLFLPNANGTDRLYRNDGGTFTEIGAAAGVASGAWSIQGAWADYDRDGDLDLYVTRNSTTPNSLYRNNGSGVFALSGAADDVVAGTAATWGDLDGDGAPDLYVVNYSQNRLYHNHGDGTFSEIGGPAGVDDFGPGGAAWGDYDNDGDLDLYLSSKYDNHLYRNDGGGTFTDVGVALGVDDSSYDKGCSWVDYDNDGDLDLFVTKYGLGALLYRNDGATFTEVADSVGVNGGGYSTAEAWADADGDGDLDLYVCRFSSSNGANLFYENNCATGNHWLQVDLQGTVSNRFGVGARVRVVTGSLSQIREVCSGSGFASQEPLTQHFGLGAHTTVDSVIVTWPNGIVQTVDPVPSVDTRVTVIESAPVGVGDGSPIPPPTHLLPNAPNPFRTWTAIRYELAEKVRVSLRVFDLNGRLVRQLKSGALEPPGPHKVTWDGRDQLGRPAPAGVYLYALQAGKYRASRRMVLLR